MAFEEAKKKSEKDEGNDLKSKGPIIMKKRVGLLILSSLIFIVSIILLVPMINYVIGFNNTINSFMSLDNAIISVVILSLLTVLSLAFAILFTVEIVKIHRRK